MSDFSPLSVSRFFGWHEFWSSATFTYQPVANAVLTREEMKAWEFKKKKKKIHVLHKNALPLQGIGSYLLPQPNTVPFLRMCRKKAYFLNCSSVIYQLCVSP